MHVLNYFLLINEIHTLKKMILPASPLQVLVHKEQLFILATVSQKPDQVGMIM